LFNRQFGGIFLSEINDYFYYPVYYAARNKDDLYTGLHFICCFIDHQGTFFQFRVKNEYLNSSLLVCKYAD